ncbi:MAG: hypothetical protein EAX81_08305 [Candidatus Thorarchaeota archaeon]|nr:hypothetical protein [Candidatus Thorarchaeota archaeon]
MAETTEWVSAVEYKKFLSTARENVELMKARYTDLMLTEEDEATLKELQNEIRILVLGTDSCDDTSGTLPVLARMAATAPKIQLRILDSNKHVHYHQNFKVNGKRKTPVVLFLSSDLQELCRWVERPNAAYKLINEKIDPSLEGRKNHLRKLYSDPEILRQSLGEFMNLLIRADFILGRH